jgi:hypothetical protein
MTNDEGLEKIRRDFVPQDTEIENLLNNKAYLARVVDNTNGNTPLHLIIGTQTSQMSGNPTTFCDSLGLKNDDKSLKEIKEKFGKIHDYFWSNNTFRNKFIDDNREKIKTLKNNIGKTPSDILYDCHNIVIQNIPNRIEDEVVARRIYDEQMGGGSKKTKRKSRKSRKVKRNSRKSRKVKRNSRKSRK